MVACGQGLVRELTDVHRAIHGKVFLVSSCSMCLCKQLKPGRPDWTVHMHELLQSPQSPPPPPPHLRGFPFPPMHGPCVPFGVCIAGPNTDSTEVDLSSATQAWCANTEKFTDGVAFLDQRGA